MGEELVFPKGKGEKRLREEGEEEEDSVTLEEKKRSEDLEERRIYCQTHGDCQIEIFNVIINNNNKKGYVSGKIFIDNGSRPTDVFRKSEEEAEFVPEGGGSLLLTGPCIGLPTYGWGLTYIHLRYHNYDKSESAVLSNCDACFDEEGEISNDTKYAGYCWEFDTGTFDSPLEHVISSSNGVTASLYFTFFREAIMATLDVRFINNNNYNKSFDIFGLITAWNTLFQEDPRYRYVLFRKKWNEKVRVVPEEEEPIQLARYVLAVPVKSKLKIRFDLESGDDVNNIPCGELTFDVPKSLTGTTENILGDKLQVKVIWKHYWEQSVELLYGH